MDRAAFGNDLEQAGKPHAGFIPRTGPGVWAVLARLYLPGELEGIVRSGFDRRPRLRRVHLDGKGELAGLARG